MAEFSHLDDLVIKDGPKELELCDITRGGRVAVCLEVVTADERCEIFLLGEHVERIRDWCSLVLKNEVKQ